MYSAPPQQPQQPPPSQPPQYSSQPPYPHVGYQQPQHQQPQYGAYPPPAGPGPGFYGGPQPPPGMQPQFGGPLGQPPGKVRRHAQHRRASTLLCLGTCLQAFLQQTCTAIWVADCPAHEALEQPRRLHSPQLPARLRMRCCLQAAPQDANGKKPKKWGVPRIAAGEKWYDPNLADWPEGDFRLFVGDMGNEVNDDTLIKAFSNYSSMQRACIVRDKRTNKSKGVEPAFQGNSCRRFCAVAASPQGAWCALLLLATGACQHVDRPLLLQVMGLSASQSLPRGHGL